MSKYCGSLNIEQKNPFIQNVNKHVYNFGKLSPAAELHFFSQMFLVNPDWKYFQNITWKNCHLTSPCYDFMKPTDFPEGPRHWVKYMIAIPKTVVLGIACLD